MQLPPFPNALPPALRRVRFASSQPVGLVRRFLDRLNSGRQSVFFWPIACTLGGFLTATATLSFDAAVGAGAIPPVLRIQVENARSLLATIAGVLVTVVSVLFWVRAAAIQLAAGQFSARVLQGYLGDRFQQAAMAFVAGSFVHVVVVLRALPGDGGDMPYVATLGAVTLVVVTIFMILTSVVRSSTDLRASTVTDRIAEATIRRIHAQAIPGDDSREIQARSWTEPPSEETVPIRADRTGWIREIDEEALLASIPPGGVVILQVRVGNFVTPEAELARYWIAGEARNTDNDAPDESEPTKLRSAFKLGPSRNVEHDVGYGLRVLADIAQRALAPGTNDYGAAGEALVRIGAVLREVLVRQPPVTPRTDHENRWIIRPRELDARGYISEAFDRIRVDAAGYPSVCAEILRTLGMLIQAVQSAGNNDYVPALKDEASLVLATAQNAGILEQDLLLLRKLALALKLVSVPAPAYATEAAERPTESDVAATVAASTALAGSTAVADQTEGPPFG